MAVPVTEEGVSNLINQTRSKLFPNFPLYNESHREELQNLIVGRFLFREICDTPVAKWHFMFCQKLMEVMPYFNQLYESFQFEGNMFDNVNYVRNIKNDGVYTMTKGTKDTTTQKSENDGMTTYQPGITAIETSIDTPQSSLDNFLAGKYMTSANKTTSEGQDHTDIFNSNEVTGSIERSGEDKNTEDKTVTERVVGKNGGLSYAELFAKYKEALYSVDMLILDSLEELFFIIY